MLEPVSNKSAAGEVPEDPRVEVEVYAEAGSTVTVTISNCPHGGADKSDPAESRAMRIAQKVNNLISVLSPLFTAIADFASSDMAAQIWS